MRAAAAALLLAGCGPGTLGIQVDLITVSCPGAADPRSGVATLRFKLTGDGFAPLSPDPVPFTSGTAQIPHVPIGANRRLTVDGLDSAGRVRARADSGKFDALGPADVHLRLFLRPVDQVTLTSDAAGNCTHMSRKRAAHAMTLLPDGRVLVTGGYDTTTDSSGTVTFNYLADAEIYDPSAGSFTPVSAHLSAPRALHSAVAVAGGTLGNAVFVAGGQGPVNNSVTAIQAFEVWSGAAWTQVSGGASPAREHHASAVDLKKGYAVLAGGQAGPDKVGVQVYDTASYFDLSQMRDAVRPLRMGALADAVAVARAKPRGGVMLVGGHDASGTVLPQISGLIWSDDFGDYADDTVYRDTTKFVLPSPRAHHVALLLNDDTVLTAGGVTALGLGAFDYSNATAEVTLIDPLGVAVNDVGTLSQARADACAALLQDGTVLVAGGAYRNPSGAHSARNVDLVTSLAGTWHVQPPGGGDGMLRDARHRAACVTLNDGSVLVTGGQQYRTGGLDALDSAEIYTPVGN
jgi:hypothetical protein